MADTDNHDEVQAQPTIIDHPDFHPAEGKAPVQLDDEKPIDAVGEPNGLPPAAPMVQLEPPAEVKALREWEHIYLTNSVHSLDHKHLRELRRHIETICARLHSKYPPQK
jgi:hypothetical protein